MNLQNLNESPLAKKARERTQYFLEEILKVDCASGPFSCYNQQGEELYLRYLQPTNALHCYTWREYIDIFDLVGFIYSIREPVETYYKTLELLQMDDRAEKNTTAVPELEASMHNPADCGGGVPLNLTYQINGETAPNNEDWYIPSLADRLPDILSTIKSRVNKPAITTPFKGLDKILENALAEPSLNVIGGVPGSGKTTLMLAMADWFVRIHNRDVLYFNLEMTELNVFSKLISAHMLEMALSNKTSPQFVLSATDILNAVEYKSNNQQATNLFNQTLEDYSKYMPRLHVIDNLNGLTVDAIKSIVEKFTAKSGVSQPPVVIIDYLQLLSGKPNIPNDKAKMDNAVNVLNGLAHSTGSLIFAICALNRTGYEMLGLSSLKESGAIEYQSSLVLMLNYAAVVDAAKTPISQKEFDLAQQQNPRKMVLSVLKNRNGPSGGNVRLDFYPAYNTFRDTNT